MPMKAIPLLTLLALAMPLAAQDDSAAAPKTAETKAAPAQPNLAPHQQAFLNLPEEKRYEFVKNLNDAMRLFGEKRIFETLEAVDKASAIFSDSPELYNLRGSCYVEMRSFDKALAEFEKAGSYSKDNPSLEFNIAEVYFVTKQWKKAADLLEKILLKLPPDNVALGRLVEFKILLCKKKLGLDDEVTILSEKYDYLDDSPFYYYAKAVVAYDKKDLVKAEEWLARAGRIFRDPAVISPWQDTLVEYGYIKSFYGDDAAGAEAK